MGTFGIETILNVDDNEGGRYAITRLMQRAGYRVIEAADGPSALAAAAQHLPDLVLLDVNMPGMDGFEVARRLKRDPATAATPILHLSATQIDSDSVAFGLEGGADGYLIQPVEPVVLIATVRALLRVRRAEKERERLIIELGESRTFLEEVLGQVPVGVLLAEAPSGKLLRANEQAARIWGVPALVAEDLEGYRKFPLFGQDNKPLPPEEWPLARALLKGERATEEELYFLRRGGERRIMLASAAPIRDIRGDIVAAVMSFSDITDRVQQREQLVETERQRRELAETLNAETSHRVKNNLAMAAGLLQLQLTEENDPRVTSVLRDTTARLLTFADIHTQLSVTRSGDVELLDAMRRIADVNRTTFGLSDADIRVEGETVSCPSRTGTTVSIMANELITNALKYGRPGADGRLYVEIGLRREEGSIVLSVWNSGNPVAAAFEPSAQRTMGLRLVWELTVAQFGGSFTLRPERDGTLAQVRLPESRLLSGT